MFSRLHVWVVLSRPPFHVVGLLPFILGCVLARHYAHSVRWDICILGICGVVLIMLSTYFAGEYSDHREDEQSRRYGKSRFAGGSGVRLSARERVRVIWASLFCLVLALGIGIVLQFVYKTGPWTIPLGIFGMLGGLFYSTRPVRWVERGFGELWIALCYGWLPVAAGYYVQTSHVSATVHWIAVPIGLTIFNVILLNEFPDYEADRMTGKKNLVVRHGRNRSSVFYACASIASWVALVVSVMYGVPIHVLYFYTPIFLLSLILIMLVVRNAWRSRHMLEWLCGLTIIVNAGTTLAYIVALI